MRYSRGEDARTRRAIAEAVARQEQETAAVEKTPVAGAGKDSAPRVSAVKPRVVAETPRQEPAVAASAGKSEVKPVPAEKTPVEKTPVEKTPVEKTPAEKTPVEKTPAEKTPVEKTPAEKTPAEKTPVEKTPAEKTQLLLEYLTGPAARAQKAYKVLWGIDKKQIPSLLRQVQSRVPTQLRELDLLVLQKDFARFDKKEQRWFYWIKGMGNFELDDIAMSKVSRPKGAVRVRLKRFKGFPLGVVVRAGLLNRFRTTRFPGLDDRKFLAQWWSLFYSQNMAGLK